jgi:periodic tryptophan protein 2
LTGIFLWLQIKCDKMKFDYKLNNVLGSVYNSGSICFTPDGNGLLSPVGNKIVQYDLRNNRSFAFGFEATHNFDQLSVSPNGSLLLATSEKNHLYMCSLVSGVNLHCKTFDKCNRLTAIQFSPDGRFYALAADSTLLVYVTPGQRGADGLREISPFKIHRVFNVCNDDITSIAWSPNSRLIAIGSRDMTIKIVSPYRSFKCLVSLAGHTHVIENLFFAGQNAQSLDLYSVSSNGQMMHWQTETGEDGLNELSKEKKRLVYRKAGRHYLTEHLKGDTNGVRLTSAFYYAKSGLLVSGYSNGAFLLHELPSFSLIHSLELSATGSIDSVCINRDGDWIGLASSIRGAYNHELETHTTIESKLVVWEWQSESFVLKQTGSGSGVLSICEAIAYSPDGNSIATGSCSGQVKLWNTASGFCFVTLPEGHGAPVTGIEYVAAKGGKVLISCSLDGTIKAYDLNRYRNFRTMQPSSKTAQFTCLSIDQQGGDVIAAGAQNTFEVFVFSLTTGRQLDELAGHSAPVSAVQFSSQGNLLASASWDGTVRLWDLFESAKCQREVILVGGECIALAFRPDGNQLCVSTSNSRLHFVDVKNSELNGVSIDVASDLGKSQAKHELQQQKDKHCTCLTYSGDGQYVMGGGSSRFLCLYNVTERLLVKKYSLSFNLSLNGFQEYVSKRKLAEFGFSVDSIKMREENDGQMVKPIQLPGVTKGDLTDREVCHTFFSS